MAVLIISDSADELTTAKYLMDAGVLNSDVTVLNRANLPTKIDVTYSAKKEVFEVAQKELQK